jgi:hypothetical protein
MGSEFADDTSIALKRIQGSKNSLRPQKQRPNVPFKQIGRHVPRNDFFIRFQRLQISVSHLGRYLESDM